jgi:O-antigen/teichoic acid export membrane protein
VGRTLARNALANFAGQAVLMSLGLLATPYLVHRFGSARYGVLMLLLTFVNALSMFQLGFNAALIKYAAEVYAQGRHEEIQNYFGTALSLFLVVGTTTAVALGALARWFVVAIFHVPSDVQQAAILGFYLASGAFLLRFIGDAFSAVPIAAQRFDIVNCIFVSSEVIRISGSVLAVYLGLLLKAVVTVNLLTNLLFLVANMVGARWLVPTLSVQPRFSREHFRKLFEFSKFVAISQFASRISNNLDGVIVAYFLPVAYVAFYAVPQGVCLKIWTFVANITSVVFPAASALSISEESKLKELYLRGSKMVAAVAALPALALCLLSREVLLQWIGPQFAEQGALALKLLSCAFLINCLMHIPDAVAQAVGRPRISARVHALETLLRVTLLLVFVPRLGITGAALGYLIAQILLTPWYVNITNRLIGVRWTELLLNAYAPILVPLTAGCLVFFALRSRICSLSSLGLIGGAGLGVYALLGAFSVLDGKERRACLAPLGRIGFRFVR